MKRLVLLLMALTLISCQTDSEDCISEKGYSNCDEVLELYQNAKNPDDMENYYDIWDECCN